MGDSAKKTIRFDSVPQTSRLDSIRFDSLLCRNPSRQSTPGVLDSGLKLLDQSTEAMTGRPAFTKELLIGFAEASSDIAANASHDS